MVGLQITENRKMRWEYHKDDFGTREERHSIGRFILRNSCRLPVTVLVQRLSRHRQFSFAPVLVNNIARNVAFQYHQFLIMMTFADVAGWIKEFIISNELYDDDRHHYFV